MTPQYLPLLDPAASAEKVRAIAEHNGWATRLTTVSIKNYEQDLYGLDYVKAQKGVPHLAVLQADAGTRARTSTQAQQEMLFFSGGLDSVAAADYYWGAKLVHVPDLKPWCKAQGIKHIELMFPLIAQVLGHTTYLDGCLMEEAPEHDQQNVWPYLPAYKEAWAAVWGIKPASPLATIRKVHAMAMVEVSKRSYSSCDHSKTWCGHCFSCYMNVELSKCLGISSQAQIEDGARARYEQEVQETARTGVDPYYGDNHIILWSRRWANKEVRHVQKL